MNNLNLEDLKKLLLDGRRAAQYAWDHYEELVARETVYTLFGPYAYGTGAAIPGKFMPKSARNLTLKTRRKNYIIYELDSEYRLLRTRDIFNSVNDNTYQCFELDGIQYAYPFSHDQKKMGCDEVLALSYKDGKPYYLGFLRKRSIIVHFFEYVSQEKVLVTAYYYNPTSKYSHQGYPTDPDAPLDTPTSAATRSYWEEEPMYTDFSYLLEHPEVLEVQKKQAATQKVDIGAEIGSWLDNILEQAMPPEVAAFCFNLYDDAGDKWSIELIGAARFDPENDDWACDEVTDFGSRQFPYSWEEDAEWEGILRKTSRALRKYLKSGKYAEKLKSKVAVGVGFVEGDITILHHQKRKKTGDGSPS